ncbi:MAG TPA: aldehyde dehydrogenase family protein [Solirubrobacteraceae bacterium]|nr:aldehyde dehydrogenase family protein [Solirubrobacteraceae bacterium]
MSERLTYVSGALPGGLDEEFERALARLRAATPEPFAHIIAGEDSRQGAMIERRDPSDAGGQVSRAYAGNAQTVAEALRAARRAQARWSRMPYGERCAHMRAVAQALGKRHIELAAVVSLETGKTRMESIAEVQEAIDLIETYCAAIEAARGFTAPLESLTASEHNIETLRPYGVFGVIAPFNFPLALAVNMLSAALIGGNTVVIKPSEAAPWTGALLGEALAAGGLPPGAFNLVHGGADTGRALVAGDVDGIAFTGSVPVGREIARALSCGAWARPVLAEMGGKNPAIVTSKADLEKAAEGIARAAFGLSGQKCSACSRAIVSAEVHDELVERLCAFTRTLLVGDPAERASALGPVIDEQAVARFEQSVELARRDGRILAGGARIALRGGHFVEPTVVAELPPGHALSLRELFLPFLTVARVESLADAIAEANAVDYGLSAGIFSEDEVEVEQFLQEIEAGVVYVNRRAGATTGAWPGAQSFCGWKASGLTGKGGLGPYYLQQFMREQSRTIVR